MLNNDIMQKTMAACLGEWELINGSDYDNDNDYYVDIFQYYIIPEGDYRILSYYTEEIVYYNEEIDVYLWGVTHYGTSWDYVLTDIAVKIKK